MLSILYGLSGLLQWVCQSLDPIIVPINKIYENFKRNKQPEDLDIHVHHALPKPIFSPLLPILRKAPSLCGQKVHAKEFPYRGPKDVHLYPQIQWQGEIL